jgi:hypothetical protein
LICPTIIAWQRGGSRIRTGAISIRPSDFLTGHGFRSRPLCRKVPL